MNNIIPLTLLLHRRLCVASVFWCLPCLLNFSHISVCHVVFFGAEKRTEHISWLTSNDDCAASGSFVVVCVETNSPRKQLTNTDRRK